MTFLNSSQNYSTSRGAEKLHGFKTGCRFLRVRLVREADSKRVDVCAGVYVDVREDECVWMCGESEDTCLRVIRPSTKSSQA